MDDEGIVPGGDKAESIGEARHHRPNVASLAVRSEVARSMSDAGRRQDQPESQGVLSSVDTVLSPWMCLALKLGDHKNARCMCASAGHWGLRLRDYFRI